MNKKNIITFIFIFNLISITIAGTTYTLQNAWQDIDHLDFRRAAKSFKIIRDKATKKSPEWLEATLGLAVSLHQRQPDTKKDKIKAGKMYEEVIATSDGKSIQATALLLRGKLDQYIDYFDDKENFNGAIGFYQQIIKNWPDSICADQAALYTAQCFTFMMNKEKAEEGIEKLEAWLKTHPNNPYASTQWLLIALTYRMPLENLEMAINSTIKAIDVGLPKASKADDIYWQIASMAEKTGNRDIAKTFYTRIIIEEQRSRYGYMAQQRLIQLGFKAPKLIDPFK